MKKVFVLISMFLCAFSVFARNGMMSGEKDLKVVSTQWFDIIYAPSSEKTAELLYENADKIYEEIAEMYGRKILYRLPVVITTQVESFNAYWTNSYYNHIVIYDTMQMEDLEIFSDTMLSTFRHELTHAYTYNMSDPFWYGIKSVFGECVSPVGINISNGWAEGATLTSESAKGEGRLNDEYAKQIVRQAKLEKQFPKYYAVQGHEDIYPYGTYYYFNGAFDQYLQKKYGMEKYSNFWYNAVNIHHIFVSHVFRKVYKKSLTKEWKTFAAEYEVPEIPGNPVEAGIVKDFFEKSKNNYSSYNHDGSLYDSLSLSKKGLTYVDEKNDSVYFVSDSELNEVVVNPEKLFTLSGLSEAVQSADGKYIAFSYETDAQSTIKSKIGIYDTLTGKMTKFPESGCAKPSVICFENEYYLVNLCFKSQFYKIRISKLTDFGTNLERTAEIEFPFEVLPYSFTDLHNGTFAFLKKEKLNWSICISDLNGNVIQEFKAPYERMVMRYLSYSDDGNLYFSYTKPGKMPDAGRLNLAENQFELSEKDISGGIYYPVKNGDSLIYSGEFFRMNRLLTVTPDFSDKISAESVVNENYVQKTAAEIDETQFTSEILANANPVKYSDFRFYKKGLLLPYSTITSYGIINDDGKSDYSVPIGLTYYTKNPWDGNLVTLSAGYSFLVNSFALKLGYSSGTNTSLFNYSLAGQAEVDLSGFKQAYFNGSVSSVIPFGNISNFVISFSAVDIIGRENQASSGSYLDSIASGLVNTSTTSSTSVSVSDYSSYYFSNKNGLKLYYTNIHKAGPGRYEKAGVLAGTEVYYTYKNKVSGAVDFTAINTGNLGIFGELYVPKLIPVNCKAPFTYNMPLNINAGLFPSSSTMSSFMTGYCKPDGVFLYGEAVLFGGEIQYPTLLTHLIYFNDFYFSAFCVAGYDLPEGYENWNFLKTGDFFGKIVNGELNLVLCPGIKATLTANPVGTGKDYLFAALNFVKTNTGFQPAISIGMESSF